MTSRNRLGNQQHVLTCLFAPSSAYYELIDRRGSIIFIWFFYALLGKCIEVLVHLNLLDPLCFSYVFRRRNTEKDLSALQVETGKVANF